MIFQILASHFCAGGEFGSDNKVLVADHIIKYMQGWRESDVIIYCTKKGWTYRCSENDR